MSKLIDVIGKNFALKNVVKRIGGVPVCIKGYVDVDTFKNIVQTVAQSCFEEGEYKAENREIARRYCIIKYMTDIETSSDNVSEIFKMTQSGMWYGAIESEIVKLPVWGDVETAIDNQIAYLIGTRQTAFDRICDDLSAILSKDTQTDLADVKQVLDGLSTVDKEAFVEAAIENNKKKATKKKST